MYAHGLNANFPVALVVDRIGLVCSADNRVPTTRGQTGSYVFVH